MRNKPYNNKEQMKVFFARNFDLVADKIKQPPLFHVIITSINCIMFHNGNTIDVQRMIN